MSIISQACLHVTIIEDFRTRGGHIAFLKGVFSCHEDKHLHIKQLNFWAEYKLGSWFHIVNFPSLMGDRNQGSGVCRMQLLELSSWTDCNSPNLVDCCSLARQGEEKGWLLSRGAELIKLRCVLLLLLSLFIHWDFVCKSLPDSYPPQDAGAAFPSTLSCEDSEIITNQRESKCLLHKGTDWYYIQKDTHRDENNELYMFYFSHESTYLRTDAMIHL